MPTGKSAPDSAADKQRIARFRILDLSAVGLAFPVALLLGYFGGRTIGGWLGNAQLGSLIGALLGIAGGFYNLFKMVSRLAPPSGGPAVPSATPASGRTGADEVEPEEDGGGDEADEDWIEDDWTDDDDATADPKADET
jgi:hypothetical protein